MSKMAFFFRRAWRHVVPVVATDIRKILEAVAHALPAAEGQALLRQIDYVVESPTVSDRSFEYKISTDCPAVDETKGIRRLADVRMCYYQQSMPFAVFLRDGYLFQVSAGDPEPLQTTADEYSILSVTISPIGI